MSLSVATLYSLYIATVVPCNNFVAGTVDQNSETHSMLRGGVHDLPPETQRITLQNQQQIFLKRRLSEIDMSSFNDDTTLEEVEELMEEGNEENDDNESTQTNIPTDDDGSDAILDEILDELTEAFVNVTNTTSDELFGNMIDTFFGPSDSNDHSNLTSSMDNVLEEVMTSIFGVDGDDNVPRANITVPESPIPVDTQEVVSTTNFQDKDSPPLPTNVTGSNTNDAKEMHIDDNDTPEPPILQTSSPTTAPQRRPTSLPTESPTSERINDFDSNDKETEKEDDDLFAEKTYHNKNRPVGNGIPNSKFSFTIVLGIFAAIIGMIFTAWQMSDNPDGIYASLCRLTLTCIHLVFRIIMSPCRKCCGGGYRNHHHLAGTNGYHEPYGHLPVSTMDYGYKDPTLELT
jgi:hypothetical protein